MPLTVDSDSAGASSGLRISCKIWRSSTASNWRDTSATLSLSERLLFPARDSNGTWEASTLEWAALTFILPHDQFRLQCPRLFHRLEHRHHIARRHAQGIERGGDF